MKRLKQKRLVSLQSADSDTEAGIFYYKCESYDAVTAVFPTGRLEDSVLHYDVFQQAYIKTRVVSKQSIRTFLVYDIENITAADFSVKALKNFCDTHTTNRGIYADILHGTFVKISDSGFLKYVLPIFDKVYTPVKPLRVSTDWNDLDNFIEDCLEGKLGLQLSTNDA